MALTISFSGIEGRKQFDETQNRALLFRIFEEAGFSGEFEMRLHRQVSASGGGHHQGLQGVQFNQKGDRTLKVCVQVGDSSTRHELHLPVSREKLQEMIRRLKGAQGRLVEREKAVVSRTNGKSRESVLDPKAPVNGTKQKHDEEATLTTMGQPVAVMDELSADELNMCRHIVEEEGAKIEEIDQRLRETEDQISSHEHEHMRLIHDLRESALTAEDLEHEILRLEEKLNSAKEKLLRVRGNQIEMELADAEHVSALEELRRLVSDLNQKRSKAEANRTNAAEEVSKAEARAEAGLRALLRMLSPDRLVRIVATLGDGASK